MQQVWHHPYQFKENGIQKKYIMIVIFTSSAAEHDLMSI